MSIKYEWTFGECSCLGVDGCGGCYWESLNYCHDMLNNWVNTHNRFGNAWAIQCVGVGLFECVEDLTDGLKDTGFGRLYFAQFDHTSELWVTGYSGDDSRTYTCQVIRSPRLDVYGRDFCGGCFGKLNADESGRVRCVECKAYGYSTHMAGSYVCFTCGHLCDCGEDLED